MSTYIELRREAFGKELREELSRRAGSNFGGVRRPLRGIQVKNDTYAVMKVIKSDGTEVKLYDSSGIPGFLAKNKEYHVRPYSNFILTSLQEARAENAQIVQTFGESFVFFFGEEPRSVAFSGALINTEDFNWKSEWWANYETYLRGTRLVEMDARLYLFYDDILLEGYLLSAATADVPDSPNYVTFQGTLLLTNYLQVSPVGTGLFPGAVAVDEIEEDGQIQLVTATSGTRQLPIRSKISDNVDEFIGGGDQFDLMDTGTAMEGIDDDAINDAEAENLLNTQLEAMGLTGEQSGGVINSGSGIIKVA